MLQIEECKILLNLLYPPIVKLNSLLGRLTGKEQKHLSKVSITVIEGATEF